MKLRASVISQPALLLAQTWLLVTPIGAAEVGRQLSGHDESKPYTMYLGTDFRVEWQGRLCAVEDVRGSAFVVNLNGKRVEIPVQFTNLKIKMDDALKVSAARANVTHFAAERAYTPNKDPRRRYDQASVMAMDANRMSDLANAQLRRDELNQGNAEAYAQAYPPDPGANINLDQATAKIGPDSATLSGNMDAQAATILTTADAGAAAGEGLGQESYDALRLTFDLSAPKPLARPYLIVIARYFEAQQRKDTGRIWVYAQSLSRVDAKPARFAMFRGGFPPGYALQDVQIHLYDGTVEVPTNLAAKRVELTADEAFQLSVVDYIQSHSHATVNPTVVGTLVPHALQARLATEAVTHPFYVKVAKNGVPTGAFSDRDCRDRVSPVIEPELMALRFNPALRDGTPVEGVAELLPATISN